LTFFIFGVLAAISCLSFCSSAWGKFCEKPNKTRTKFVKSKTELAKLCNDPALEVSDFHIINDDIIAIDVKAKYSFEPEFNFQSEIIGALTTAYGRLMLYGALDRTNFNTTYMDTDSVIVIQPKGEDVLSTGCLLGDLTSEVPPDVTMTEFVSSGPKSYGFRCSNGSEVLKLKGISLNYSNSRVFNFDLMKKVVLRQLDLVTTPPATQISRVKHHGIIYRKPLVKSFKRTLNKRVLHKGSHVSIPYGYRGHTPCR